MWVVIVSGFYATGGYVPVLMEVPTLIGSDSRRMGFFGGRYQGLYRRGGGPLGWANIYRLGYRALD